MMKKPVICILLIPLLGTMVSCGTDKNESEIQEGSPGTEKSIPEPIQFNELEVEAYPDAIIEIHSPLGNQNFKEGKVPFEFNIKNYPFNDDLRKFRLSLAINGDNPIGYNMPIFQREFETGTYRAVAYLVDQQGIALKEYGNYVDRDFMVGDSRPFPESDEPYMVVNLPENNQVYQEGEDVIVDLLLIGGALKEDKLRFILSVLDQEHEIESLDPISIENLPPGKHEIQVKLVKAHGEELEGIFTTARREIPVEASKVK